MKIKWMNAITASFLLCLLSATFCVGQTREQKRASKKACQTVTVSQEKRQQQAEREKQEQQEANTTRPENRPENRPEKASQTTTASQEIPQTIPGPVFHTRPKVESDPQRPRRTVPVDGVIGEGDWDVFYVNRDGPIKGTIYCNWDENYLYLAARTDGPATVIFDIDATNDGWLRSADNLEIVVGGVGESGGVPSVIARLLDATNNKETPVWNTLSNDARQIKVAGKLDGSKQVVTIAIPKNVGSIVLHPGATLGIRGEFIAPGEAGEYKPTAPFEPHLLLEANLVESRTSAVAGVTSKLSLSDVKCVPGQKLFSTLEIYNQTDVPLAVKSVLWTGLGNSANAVNTVREVAIKPIAPMRREKLGYKTVLPPDLPIGSYTLTVTADLASGKQIQSSASFSVVEPIYPSIASVPDPITVVGPTNFTVAVSVVNSNPGQMNCDIELISIPAGWELADKRSKLMLTVDKQDGRGTRQFVFKIPSITPAGDYPIDVTVTYHNRVWKLRTVAHVLRPDVAPAKPNQK